MYLKQKIINWFIYQKERFYGFPNHKNKFCFDYNSLMPDKNIYHDGYIYNNLNYELPDDYQCSCEYPYNGNCRIEKERKKKERKI